MKIIITERRIESKFISNEKGINKFLFLIKKMGFRKSFDNRIVNSLYYDNHNLSSVCDNLSGVTPRKKYRLRWYNNETDKFYGYQFENKIKDGITGFKKILLFDKNISFNSIHLSIERLKILSKYENERFFPSNFYPQLVCSYSRQYFENSLSDRITIDSNIKYRKYKKNFNIDLAKIPLKSNINILEVKFAPTHDLGLLPLFRKLPTPSTRISKYLLGHAKLNKVSYV